MRHDGAGRGNGWHLAWVKASNLTTGAVAMFKCNGWVDRRRHEDPGIVAVVVALPPDQAAAAGGQLSGKDRLLLGGGSKAFTAAAAALQAPQVPGVRREAELGSSPGVGAEEGGVEAGGLPGYRVVFHTSRICGSGTHAKVGGGMAGPQAGGMVVRESGGSMRWARALPPPSVLPPTPPWPAGAL